MHQCHPKTAPHGIDHQVAPLRAAWVGGATRAEECDMGPDEAVKDQQEPRPQRRPGGGKHSGHTDEAQTDSDHPRRVDAPRKTTARRAGRLTFFAHRSPRGGRCAVRSRLRSDSAENCADSRVALRKHPIGVSADQSGGDFTVKTPSNGTCRTLWCWLP